MGVGVGSTVAVGVGVSVDVGNGVSVGVDVGVGDGTCVGEGVGVLKGVEVNVGVGCSVGSTDFFFQVRCRPDFLMGGVQPHLNWVVVLWELVFDLRWVPPLIY